MWGWTEGSEVTATCNNLHHHYNNLVLFGECGCGKDMNLEPLLLKAERERNARLAEARLALRKALPCLTPIEMGTGDLTCLETDTDEDWPCEHCEVFALVAKSPQDAISDALTPETGDNASSLTPSVAPLQIKRWRERAEAAETERDALLELERAVLYERAQGHYLGDERSFGPTPINKALSHLAKVRGEWIDSTCLELPQIDQTD